MKNFGILTVGIWMLLVCNPAFAQQQDLEGAQPGIEQGQPGQGDQSVNLQNYIELMRSNLKTQKRQILTKSMELDEAQAKAFWPIYNDYEHDLAKLTDKGLAVIMDYSKHYQNMTDDMAHDLITRTLDNQAEKVKLRKAYARKLEKALSPRVAARFLQVDGVVNKMVELQLDSQIPLVK